MATIKVTKSLDTNKVWTKLIAGITLYGQTASKILEAEAKSTAPWTDRTSNARNSIQGDFSFNGKKATITISGNMPYSIWLELANDKQYATLESTIERNATSVLNGYARVIGE